MELATVDRWGRVDWAYFPVGWDKETMPLTDIRALF